MTTVAVLADPPQQGSTLDGLVDAGVLDADEAATLYTATLCDACLAVERSGGELLVNYRNPGDASGNGETAGDEGTAGDEEVTNDGEATSGGGTAGDGGATSDEAARDAVQEALSLAFENPEALRYEVQVGSTRSARIGNTVTHLLETEEVRSAAVVDPAVTLLERRFIDSAAMKLRQSEVVLGPATAGRLWYAAFTEPIDFADAFDAPALRTVTERGRSKGLDVDFLETLPVVDDAADLASSIVQFQARERAEQFVPPYTRAAFDELELDVTAGADGLAVRRNRETDSS